MKHKSMRPAIFLLMTLALSASTLLNVVNGSDSAIGRESTLAPPS